MLASAPCFEGPVHCALHERFAADPKARALAIELFDKTGTVSTVLPEQDFEGGYRGTLHLVPRLPIGALRVHLQWVHDALLDFDAFFTALGGKPAYRWRKLELRFFESVKRKTPSAFAVDWSVAYNTSGSLFGSFEGVRMTMFHEVFHLNDQARGFWSEKALGPIYDRIVAKCGLKTECLTPFAPDSLKVRGGTYYAFHGGNGVTEYAADLAKRYYVEQRLVQQKKTVIAPFKCGPRENADAWKLLIDAFFDGIDGVPPCAGD